MRPFSPTRWVYWPFLARAVDPAQPLPTGLYKFIWRLTSHDQLLLSALTLLIIPLSTLPLELQRRMVNEAIGQREAGLLLTLGAVWVTVLLLQGGLKYLLNLRRGLVVEKVARELRRRVHTLTPHAGGALQSPHDPSEAGLLVSMVAAESEDVAGFVAESISTPLLQGGTILAVLGYLIWVQPLIAALSLLLYLPELVIVPWQQQTINRLGRLHTRVVRRLGIELVREELTARASAGKRFDALVDRAFDARLANYRIKYGLTFLGNLLDAVGPLAVLGVGGWLVMQGQSSVGALVVFITGLQKVGDPLDQLMGFYRTTQNALVKYELIVKVLAAPATLLRLSR